MFDDLLLSLIVFLPLAGAIIVAILPRQMKSLIHGTAVLFSGAALVLGLVALFTFDHASSATMQFDVNASWIESIGARYHMAVDGISLPMVVLTVVLTFLCVLYTIKIVPKPQEKFKGLFSLMLLLETGMLGTFTSLDLILWFVFWEMVLVPMYFIISIWGSERKEYSAIKFFLYTFFGSVFMLLSFLALYFRSDVGGGVHTFDMLQLAQQGSFGTDTFHHLVFLGLFLGFAIKVPMWPFHTWLPDAHGDAPTVGSVLLAGVMLKMGTYAFIRIALPILPDTAHAWAPWIGGLAAIAIIYGALNCFAQTDIKRLIAFSSVGHMGFVMLGIATLTDTGINAAIFGMVAHGVITGMLFFLAGSMYERYHTRQIDDIGPGVLQKLPRMGVLLTFTAIASLGLPGLAGFWGEILSLLAAFNPADGLSVGLFRAYMVAGSIGTVLTAGYLLWLVQRLNLGQVKEKWASDPDIDDVRPMEWIAWAPLLVAILALGVWPRAILDTTNDAVTSLTSLFTR
jgi:NADH-quinone oxidoreductase subunit M